jgi:hypothetical protein
VKKSDIIFVSALMSDFTNYLHGVRRQVQKRFFLLLWHIKSAIPQGKRRISFIL